MKDLLILSTQRSGSTLVCDDIYGTKVLGKPTEYFIPIVKYIDSLSSADIQNMFDTIMTKGRTQNNIFSVKVMSNQVKAIGKALIKGGMEQTDNSLDAFYNFFKVFFFLRVIRRDKVAQAVSRIIAFETNIYHRIEKSGDIEQLLGKYTHTTRKEDEYELVYNKERIENEISKITNEEKFLDDFINNYKLRPFVVYYEDIIIDRSYVYKVANKMGIGDIELSERNLKKISGRVSQDWIARFKKECSID